MWPFRKKQRATLLAVPHLDIASEDAELERARRAALEALDRSIKAVDKADAALKRGAPADCPEMKEATNAMHDANLAVRAWVEVGGL